MAFGSKTNATQLTSISTRQYFDTLITLAPTEFAHCQVDFNFQASPTDHAKVTVWATLDASSENWDDTPFLGPFILDKATDPNAASFVVFGCYKFRVSVERDGSTDTHTSADFSYRIGTP